MMHMDPNEHLELDPPDGIDTVDEAVELLRAWVGDGHLLVSLNASAFGDNVADWGRLLAGIGQHIAKAAVLNGYMREDEAQALLLKAFLAASSSLPPDAAGRLKNRQDH